MREANNNKNSNSNPATATKSQSVHLSHQASATSTTPVTSTNTTAQGHLDFASLLDVAAAEKERLHKFVDTKYSVHVVSF